MTGRFPLSTTDPASDSGRFDGAVHCVQSSHQSPGWNNVLRCSAQQEYQEARACRPSGRSDNVHVVSTCERRSSLVRYTLLDRGRQKAHRGICGIDVDRGRLRMRLFLDTWTQAGRCAFCPISPMGGAGSAEPRFETCRVVRFASVTHRVRRPIRRLLWLRECKSVRVSSVFVRIGEVRVEV